MTKPSTNPHQILTSFSIDMPDWIKGFISSKSNCCYLSDQDKINLVLDALEIQIKMDTGGPFAAIVFDPNGWIISIGVNLVVPENNSTAHAEMIALQLAQKTIANFSLNSIGKCTLASSSQPCAQCCGAGVWAGISKLLVACSSSDTEEILGFDEGPIHPNWIQEYEQRGITVIKDLERDKACDIIKNYQGIIYNGN